LFRVMVPLTGFLSYPAVFPILGLDVVTPTGAHMVADDAIADADYGQRKHCNVRIDLEANR
jgi:hypothetical protein